MSGEVKAWRIRYTTHPSTLLYQCLNAIRISIHEFARNIFLSLLQNQRVFDIVTGTLVYLIISFLFFPFILILILIFIIVTFLFLLVIGDGLALLLQPSLVLVQFLLRVGIYHVNIVELALYRFLLTFSCLDLLSQLLRNVSISLGQVNDVAGPCDSYLSELLLEIGDLALQVAGLLFGLFRGLLRGLSFRSFALVRL